MLKPHMDAHNRKEATDVALLHLLTKDKKEFLYTNDKSFTSIFNDCPFTKLQTIVKVWNIGNLI